MSAAPITQHVALFQSIDYPGTPSAWTRNKSWKDGELVDDAGYCPSGYVRVSEWVAITFPPLASDEVVAAQVAAVTEQRAKVVEEFTAKLANIDAHLANLRAITFQPAMCAMEDCDQPVSGEGSGAHCAAHEAELEEELRGSQS